MAKEINIHSSRLAKEILIAMAVGIGLGLAADIIAPYVAKGSLIDGIAAVFSGLFHIIGQMFILSMRMLVVPLLLFSLITGVASLGDIKTLGRVGVKALTFYIVMTIIAVALAVFFGTFFQIGKGAAHALQKAIEIPSPPPIEEAIIALIPSNPFEAMARGDMLQIIVFAVLVGITISLMGKKARRLKTFFSDMNDLTLKLVILIMRWSPIGIFALLIETFSKTGLHIVGPLAKYLALTIFVLGVHFFAVNGALFVIFTRLSFFHLIYKIRSALMIAFSTASSNAAMPTTLMLTEKRIGVSNRIASFTIPLGTTINMNGSAIMQGMAAIFIANAYQIELSLAGYLTIILTTLFASIGAAGVPGTGIITLSMVLHQVGLPIEGIGLIIGIDRLIEMIRTMVNIFGDVVVTAIIAKSEGELDLKKFHLES